MSGLAILIDRAGTGPVLDTDAILNTGSLLLIDPNHGTSSWSSGVPQADTYLPNLAQDIARAAIGSSSAEVRPRLTVGSGQGSGFVLQRTPKGGLHGIVSQSALVTGNGARIDIPQAILDYINLNPNHRLFASLWLNTTRISGNASASTQGWVAGLGTTGTTAANYYHFSMRTDITRPNASTSPNPAGLIPSGGSGSDVAGVKRRNIGTSGIVGTGTAPLLGSAIQWGAFGILASGNQTPVTSFPSQVFYRFYLEDLTISGRTYAQVDAIDSKMYTDKILTSGGAYNGDTPNNPSSVLP